MAGTEYVVKATDAASAVFAKIGLSAEKLDGQLHDLSDRVATPEVDLKDAKFTAGIIRAAERIDKLSAMVADPAVEVDTRKAQAEIFRITAMLDRLDAKRVSVSVDVDRSFMSRLGGKFFGLPGGGGGGERSALAAIFGGGGAQGASGAAGGLGSLGPIAMGIGAALAAALAPALLPTGLGLLAGGGAAGGAFMLGSAANKQMQALSKQLASAKPGQRGDIRGQMAALQKQSGPELAIFGAFQDVGATFKDVFAGALKSGGQGSFLTGLTGILKQIGGFLKSIGPQLGDLFRASLPFVKMFINFLEKSGKTLLPVFTQSLKQMTPYLPMIFQGLNSIVTGLAGMMKSMGPGGMKAAAQIFVALCKTIEIALILVGKTATFLAENIVKAAHNMRETWDRFRHDTAVIFDGVRHDIAHIWDLIWNNTIGRIERGVTDIHHEFDTWRHDTAVIFDGVRHDIASAWDTIWRNTVTRVQHGIDDVIRWFKSLPGRAINAIEGLGTSLYNFGHMVLTKMWNGLKSVFNDVWGWFKSLPGKLLNAIGIHSPPDWAVDAGKHIMGGLLKGITSRKDELLGAMGSIGGGAASRFAAGGGVQRWAGVAREALAMEGLSQGLLGRVLFQMQTESGGNPNAINNWDSNAAAGDPSRGLLQVIGSTFAAYHWPGTSWNIYDPLANIAAAINYARHRYGPTLMSGGMGMGSGHGYAAGSWNVPYTGPALVHQGEIIVPAAQAAAIRAGAGGGNTYNITVNVPPGANKADMGREVVSVIREYERRSGTSWRR